MPWASITDNNVDHFITLLEQVESDADRSRLQKLLVAEEDRYAQFELLEHRRDILDSRIESCKDKIAQQAKLLDGIRRRGGPDVEAEIFMKNLVLIHHTLASVRARS